MYHDAIVLETNAFWCRTCKELFVGQHEERSAHVALYLKPVVQGTVSPVRTGEFKNGFRYTGD